jgi:hypothetical protein
MIGQGSMKLIEVITSQSPFRNMHDRGPWIPRIHEALRDFGEGMEVMGRECQRLRGYQ